MKITIINKQSSLKIFKTDISNKVKKILQKENILTDEVIINFVDTSEIIRLHKVFFNDPSSTDCISFPIDSYNEAKIGYSILGEVFICTDTAIEYAQENNISVNDELMLYLVHCILHLIGYDDKEKEDIEKMRKKEKEILNFLRENE
ncbi:MAG: rRNA maturation RNase YbeY [Chlamydiae bacterium RIFCSPHIGHO2_12_FULL_27_8]|nr:MAG: rRNA maturation RNase YbeY [Chlamydiae bacterium RIFCSPHIGHO2_12_FULL_27_8]